MYLFNNTILKNDCLKFDIFIEEVQHIQTQFIFYKYTQTRASQQSLKSNHSTYRMAVFKSMKLI